MVEAQCITLPRCPPPDAVKTALVHELQLPIINVLFLQHRYSEGTVLDPSITRSKSEYHPEYNPLKV